MKSPLIALAIVLAACQVEKDKEIPVTSSLEAEYWSTVADEALPLSVTLLPNGATHLCVRSNRDQSGRSSLGYFEGPASHEAVEGVLAALRTKEFAGISNPDSVTPGEVVRKISVKGADQPEIIKFVGESQPAQPAFLRAEEQFIHAIDLAWKHPVHAMSFSTTALPSQVRSGQEFRFDINLSNPGIRPLRVSTPKSWADSGTEILAKGIRTDIPLARLDNSHAPYVVIGPDNIVDSVAATADPFVVLEPGESIRLPVRLRLDWESGLYDIQIVFGTNLVDADGQTLTRIEWISRESHLAVSGPQR